MLTAAFVQPTPQPSSPQEVKPVCSYQPPPLSTIDTLAWLLATGQNSHLQRYYQHQNKSSEVCGNSDNRCETFCLSCVRHFPLILAFRSNLLPFSTFGLPLNPLNTLFSFIPDLQEKNCRNFLRPLIERMKRFQDLIYRTCSASCMYGLVTQSQQTSKCPKGLPFCQDHRASITNQTKCNHHSRPLVE